MNLTENFTLEELTATRTGAKNEPGTDEINNLRALAVNILQPARSIYNGKITVNSGYRSEEVNQLTGGAKNSQHRRGQAADLGCGNNTRLFNIIKNNLNFDQLIWEGGNDDQPAWVHVSYVEGKNRHNVLKLPNGKYKPF